MSFVFAKTSDELLLLLDGVSECPTFSNLNILKPLGFNEENKYYESNRYHYEYHSDKLQLTIRFKLRDDLSTYQVYLKRYSDSLNSSSLFRGNNLPALIRYTDSGTIQQLEFPDDGKSDKPYFYFLNEKGYKVMYSKEIKRLDKLHIFRYLYNFSTHEKEYYYYINGLLKSSDDLSVHIPRITTMKHGELIYLHKSLTEQEIGLLEMIFI